MDEIISYLKNHPDKASEYAQIWEELLAVYPQLSSVNSQQEWQQFRREHSGIALDEDLWIYGPASLDESIQKVITQSLEEGTEETAADTNKQKKEVKPGLSLQRIVGLGGEDSSEIGVSAEAGGGGASSVVSSGVGSGSGALKRILRGG